MSRTLMLLATTVLSTGALGAAAHAPAGPGLR